MEENVALDSSKQKKFVKSLKGIKKLMKKNEQEKVDNKPITNIKHESKKVKKQRPNRGLVYLSHIPHGFYEHQMTEYFKQFGMVTNARVIRSQRTGNSKGYGFVEFRDPAVAQIVAETMNNYLMGKRLIKAVYIPPEKQKRNAFRKNWNSQNNPGIEMRLKMKKVHNANRDEAGELKKAKQLLSNLAKTKRKLREIGINYDFFVPVDIPEGLEVPPFLKQEKTETEDIKVKDERNVKAEDTEFTKKNKEKIKKGQENVETKYEKTEIKKKDKKGIQVDEKSEFNIKTKSETVIKSQEKASQKKQTKKVKSDPNIVKVKTNAKEEIKPLQDFIKVQNNSDESDSSFEFDSDEFEKMLENDSSNEENSDDDGSNDDAGNDEEDNKNDDTDIKNSEIVTKKNISMNTPVKQKAQLQKAKMEEKELKRKANQKAEVATKKSKFEKQIKQKPTNNLFKKK